MKYTLKIKPYGETERETICDDFEEDEWDLVFKIYERLFREFREKYTETNFESITSQNNIITILFSRKIPLSEGENEEYIQGFCGYSMENLLILDGVKYFIKGETVLKN